jgi:hypothetical protein
VGQIQGFVDFSVPLRCQPIRVSSVSNVEIRDEPKRFGRNAQNIVK